MVFYNNYNNLTKDIMSCTKCELCKTRNKIVVGEGNINAKLMFIGEAPGYHEDKIGKPFVGKAGKLLDQILNRIGLDRNDIYICNILKCRPPGNRNPKEEEINACIDYLKNQIMIIKPKIIVLLGSVALKQIFGEDMGITKSRGKWLELKGIYYLPTWHPAAVLRDENKLKQFYRDLKLSKYALDKLENKK